MLYLAMGAAALALFVWIGRGKPRFSGPAWRILWGVGAVASFAAGAFLAARGGWALAPIFLILGLWMAASARSATPRATTPPPADRTMSLSEARAILGVDEAAGAEEIRAAYARLIRRAHPDAGGSAGLAAQLNAARDRLLKR